MAEGTAQFPGITPYLHCDDVGAMIEWLQRVFGFAERGRWLDGDPAYWKQKSRRPEEWIGVWVDDVDTMYARVQAAGVAAHPPENKFYGIRVFEVTDPEGYTWGFMRRAPYVARF